MWKTWRSTPSTAMSTPRTLTAQNLGWVLDGFGEVFGRGFLEGFCDLFGCIFLGGVFGGSFKPFRGNVAYNNLYKELMESKDIISFV